MKDEFFVKGIDHNHPHSATSGGHVLHPSPNIVLVKRTSWNSDSDVESFPFTSHWNIDSPIRFSYWHHPSFGPHDTPESGLVRKENIYSGTWFGGHKFQIKPCTTVSFGLK